MYPELPRASFHVFERHGELLLFDVGTATPVRVDPVAFTYLGTLERTGDPRLACESTRGAFGAEAVKSVEGELRVLADHRFFSSPASPDYRRLVRNYVRWPPSGIELFISHACNFRCRYCYERSNASIAKKHMPDEVARQAVDFAIARSGSLRRVNFTFFGGEPTLNMDGIRLVVAYARKRCMEHGKRARFAIVTNGSRVKEHEARFFRANRFSVTVSLDGPEEVHNRMRPSANGRASFPATMAGVSVLRQAGVEPFGRCTVTRECLDLPRLVHFFRGAGFKGFQLTCAEGRAGYVGPFDIGPEHWPLWRHAREGLAEELLQGPHDAKCHAGNPLLTALREIQHGRGVGLPCGVTRAVTTVDGEGKLYPCHRYVGMESFVMGDIWRGVDKNRQVRYLAEYFRVRALCSSCWARNVCELQCPWDFSAEDGHINPLPPWRCQQARLNAEQAVWTYADLAAAQPVALGRLLGPRRQRQADVTGPASASAVS